jgi:DNA repair protein RecO (recombination protein O)
VAPETVSAARRTQALVLRAYEYGETSQILHLLTREEGRVHGIAKGARRLNGSFHGGADSLHFGEALVYPRRPGAELRTLGGFSTATHFPGLRERIPRFHAASHVLALLLAFTREEAPDPFVFELAVGALRLLEVADDTQAPAIGTTFEAMLLRHAGFLPDLTQCALCGKPAKNVTTTLLSPLRGGLLCRGCAPEDPTAVRVSGAVVAALRAASSGPLAAALRFAPDAATARGLREALDAWTTVVLDRPLRTSQFL